MNAFERLPQNDKELNHIPPPGAHDIPGVNWDDVFSIEPPSPDKMTERPREESFDFSGGIDPTTQKALDQEKRSRILNDIHGNA